MFRFGKTLEAKIQAKDAPVPREADAGCSAPNAQKAASEEASKTWDTSGWYGEWGEWSQGYWNEDCTRPAGKSRKKGAESGSSVPLGDSHELKRCIHRMYGKRVRYSTKIQLRDVQKSRRTVLSIESRPKISSCLAAFPIFDRDDVFAVVRACAAYGLRVGAPAVSHLSSNLPCYTSARTLDRRPTQRLSAWRCGNIKSGRVNLVLSCSGTF